MISLRVNGDTRTVDVNPETPLLWVLRDHLGLTGTKYGCGIAVSESCGSYVCQVAEVSIGIDKGIRAQRWPRAARLECQ
jgi:isoquinoline 1-oxidoreductase alpha subunit